MVLLGLESDVVLREAAVLTGVSFAVDILGGVVVLLVGVLLV